MRRPTKFGIICLVIGLSFLAGAFYRSNSTGDSAHGAFPGLPLNAHSWSGVNETTVVAQLFWAPRDLRLDIKGNATIDVYVLDAEGIRLWKPDGTFKSLWAFKNVTQEVFTLQVPSRGKYAIVVYNPTDSPVIYEIHATLYGYEKDLLWISAAFILAGAIITAGSFLTGRKRRQ